MRHYGRLWRQAVSTGAVPPPVRERWRTVVTEATTNVADVLQKPSLLQALIELMAIADEACFEVGVLRWSDSDAFEQAIFRIFVQAAKEGGGVVSLGRRLDHKQLGVLPKLHTPRSGITIRSMSHNLALCHLGEIAPSWIYAPTTLNELIDQKLDLLIFPWPLDITPKNFSEVPKADQGPVEMPLPFRFFQYKVPPMFDFEGLDAVLKAAKESVPQIHGVIFPELSLRESDADRVRNHLHNLLSPNTFFVAGISGDGSPWVENSAICWLPVTEQVNKVQGTRISQQKHHRWLLGESQVRQYGLSRILDPKIQWWEHSRIGPRSLKFVSISPHLTLTFLICEDLARQDPIGELIRSIGPNLVIALLMDGPQLASRWPARYATVLADDPGCSVLTLSSLGMTRLCRPLGKGESRVVALWKDAKNGPFEIELPTDARALVLSLKFQPEREWTIDGRSNLSTKGNWILEAVQPIRGI